MQYDRRPQRQDTFEIRGNNDAEDHYDHSRQHYSDQGHSIMEDDSGDEHDNDFIDEEDDGSSSLSIPNESIDFDLVYSLHTFVATVEGQANVVKGDSLSLMDDSNSYWWLVRVLKTQEIGYIPAENIETPFERLARLNKHRNIDLASATQAERQEDIRATRERMRAAVARTTSPSSGHSNSKAVIFNGNGNSVFYYPPAVWGDEIPEDDGWDEEEYESYDENEDFHDVDQGGPMDGMEPDDGMSWEESTAVEEQARKMTIQQQPRAAPASNIPAALRPGGGAGPQQVQQQQIQASVSSGAAQQQAQLGLGQAPIRHQSSRDRMAQPQEAQVSSSRAYADPAESQGTKTISLTPSVARGPEPEVQSQTRARSVQSPVNVAQTQPVHTSPSQQDLRRIASGGSQASSSEMGKRSREEGNGNESDVSESSRKKGKKGSEKDAAKLRKSGRSSTPTDNADESSNEGKEKEKKKKSGMFGGLFSSKKKDKKEKEGKKADDTGSTGSIGRMSEDSSASQLTASPQTDNHAATQASAIAANARRPVNSTDPRRSTVSSAPDRSRQAPSNGPAVRLQQADMEQQARYQQYLSRSPTSTLDATSGFGLQTAATQGRLVPDGNGGSAAPNALDANGRLRNNRPGSLILSPGTMDGAPVPELSVMRVFAGDRLQSEATFKTVLLNQSTTAGDLVRQAIQRFRLAPGEDDRDYFLTVKQLDGDEAELGPDEHPLGLWEELVESAMNMPTIKRSSISSISSNLSAHPAITKLAMSDFTDDSTVKFYLNRRSSQDQALGFDHRSEIATNPSSSGDSTVVGNPTERSTAPSSILGEGEIPRTSSPDHIAAALGKLSGQESGPPVQASLRPHLHVATGPSIVSERFSSPSVRFAVQVVIYPEDLPEGMVFDPHTEAIVPKYTLQNRSQSSAAASPGVNQTLRKKVFVFPKNTTVAEVIESGLERFGIPEGVVDGGDEVEDKMNKRKSSARVRYGLVVQQPGEPERELNPSSKVLEAFARPPAFKNNDRRSADLRRRSLDSSQLLGTVDDVHSGDPVFILRRAATYRASGSRQRLSLALDEVSLRQSQIQRESSSSERSAGSEYPEITESPPPQAQNQQAQLSGRELIAAQRAASRANQLALLAQSNSERGVDVVLPDNGRLRSTRSDVDERTRYSYVQPDGETYDISDIIEEEWWEVRQDANARSSPAGYSRNEYEEDPILADRSFASNGSADGGRDSPIVGRADLLQDVSRKPRDVMEQQIDRVLSKIKDGKRTSRLMPLKQQEDSRRSESPSLHNDTPSPNSLAQFLTRHSSSRSTTPVQQKSSTPEPVSWNRSSSSRTSDRDTHSQQPSIASVLSDFSPVDSSTTPIPDVTNSPSSSTASPRAPSPMVHQPPVILKDDFGMAKMMAIIEMGAASKRPPSPPPLSMVDELLFGPTLSMSELHPAAREIYESSFQQLDEMDRKLDLLLQANYKAPSLS